MRLLAPCLSRVRFGSYLAYSPRGKSVDSEKSRTFTYAIKNGREGFVGKVVTRLRAEMAVGQHANLLYDVLGEDVLVIPCPRSAPLVKGALWPSKEISDELVRQGLARECAPILERVTAVPKSSTSAIGERPKPLDHIRSMKVVDQTGFIPPRIVIVDDVITRGATSLAAASLVKHAFPDADVKIFAAVRTTGLEPEVGKILDPVIGEVSFNGIDADRNP